MYRSLFTAVIIASVAAACNGSANTSEAPTTAAEGVFTSAHQVVGALLLSAAVSVWIWQRRRLSV